MNATKCFFSVFGELYFFNLIQECESKKARQWYQQAVERTADQLAVANRIKRRKLGAGAPSLIDDDEEAVIAKSIEEKATYHGRRHNTVICTNRHICVHEKNKLVVVFNTCIYKIYNRGQWFSWREETQRTRRKTLKVQS